MRTLISIVARRMLLGAVLVLGLSTVPASANAQELRDQYPQAPRDTVTQAVYGEDVLGTTIAPHLIPSLNPEGPANTKELFTQIVCAGRAEKGMPSWCALGMELPTIEKLYAYVKGRSDARIDPGRPALKPGS